MHRDMGVVSLDPKTKQAGLSLAAIGVRSSTARTTSPSTRRATASFPIRGAPVCPTPPVRCIAGMRKPVRSIYSWSTWCSPMASCSHPTNSSSISVSSARTASCVLPCATGGKSHVFLHVMTYCSGGWGPDSMGMDILGNLYVGHFGYGKVFGVEPCLGEIIEVIDIPDPAGLGGRHRPFCELYGMI